MAEIKLVVGLGNPGQEYVDTRHNIGFKVIDSLAERLSIRIKKRKFGARFGTGEFAGQPLILLKPWRFMNQSGQPVATAMDFYGLKCSQLFVISDDMALALGKIRIRAKGSAGGHNGLSDIIEKLGTNEFARCRVGIGASTGESSVDYVLDRLTEKEKPLINQAVERAGSAVLCWIEFDVDKAMNEFNKAIDVELNTEDKDVKT
jgi:PTH1 family peptidyl-tRNA hydrolase